MALFTEHSRFVLVSFLTSLLFVDMVLVPRFCSNAESSEIRCKGEERQALLDIKVRLDDPANSLSSWSIRNKDCCRWTGITCDNSTGNVVGLDLETDGTIPEIGGDISPSLVRLQHLTHLDLSWMNLSFIPEFLGSLSQLKYLDLSGGSFEGTMPHQLGNLSKLETLDISHNFKVLYVDRLGWLSRLSSLKFLALSNVDFTGAADWLETLKMMPSLTSLTLERCKFPNHVDVASLASATASNSLTSVTIDGNSFHPMVFPWLLNISSNLVNLSMPNNGLKGEILNKLDGTLPENIFSNLPKLEVLNLKGNKIKGVLPKSIGNLSALRILDVSSNNLSGMISEAHFMKLSSLRELDLSYNSLVPNLSNNWIPPFQLDSLTLTSCKVGPHFPAWLHSQNNLTILDISNTGISSEIPSWFWNMTSSLGYLNLSSNLISCEIPDLSLEFRTLASIDLSNNHFRGPIPHFLSNASALNLSGNSLNGSINFLCSKTEKQLLLLDLSNNMLSGELPDCFRPWNQLFLLNLANNNFSGRIPTSLGSLTQLNSLQLCNNSFKGPLPSSLRNCTRLEFLDPGTNKIEDSVPAWIGESLTDLILLRLRSNEFNGSFPSSLCRLDSLRILDLSFNSLSGKIPHCIGKFTSMSKKGSSDDPSLAHGYGSLRKTAFKEVYYDSALVTWKGIEHEYNKTLGLLRVIDISSNKLTEDIPNELIGLLELIILNLSRNSLAGSIPKKIGQLKALESLDLSRNKLSGGIPDSLAHISSLSFLDVSCNNLSGKIPTGTQLQTFDPSNYAGNTELCGPPLPLSKRCHGDKPEREKVKTGDDRPPRDGVLSEETYFYIGIAVGFFAGFWGFCGSLVLSSSWRCMYFKFLNVIKDRIFLAIVLKMASLRRTSTA